MVVDKLRFQCHRDSTKKNYYGIWKNFNSFYLRLDRKPTSWEERLVLYVAYLIDAGRKSTTIKCYISAIRAILQDADVHLEENKILLTSLTRACRIHQDRATMKLPITKSTLYLILQGVHKIFVNPPQPYLEILYKTMFTVAYYGLFRVGELTKGEHNIKAIDVKQGVNKNKLKFILHSSKTHGKGARPQIVKIKEINPHGQTWYAGKKEKGISFSKQKSSSLKLCPFKLVKQYLKVRKLRRKQDRMEAFFIMGDRSPVTPNNFRKVLSQALTAAGLDNRYYYPSGLRAGHACDLLEMGVSVETIKKLGRWLSNSVYTYLRL